MSKSINLLKVYNAFFHARDGLRDTFREENAFRVEVVVAIFAIPLALFLNVTAVEKALLVGSVLLVMVVELLNTAVENAINRISLEIHPLSKRAKDTGSAAVLMSVALAAVIWGAVIF